MLIGIVGKPSSGKSTFFKAATLVDVAISPRPFTTIKPNRGIAYVRAKCPCAELKVTCNPKHGSCKAGTRYVPVELLDVAGLVPGAHEGRGLGNQFLTDLARADCLIHVVDVSGTTDAEGNLTRGHDPAGDVRFLSEEIDWWFEGILQKHWKVVERRLKMEKAIDVFSDILSGLNIGRDRVARVLQNFSPKEDSLLEFAKILRKESKPIIIAANKIDLPDSEGNFEKLKKEFPEIPIVPVFSEGELALRQAAARGLIDYSPGAGKFSIIGKLAPEQERALGVIGKKIEKYASTGVEETIETAAFKLLGKIVVYPVENEGKYSDKAGNILPDAVLLPDGSTPPELAGAIHTDLAKNFISAVNARTKMRISAETRLKSGDIVKIVSGRGA
ncbi:MAG: redox-regulated ATPase YchF [archaeon]